MKRELPSVSAGLCMQSFCNSSDPLYLKCAPSPLSARKGGVPKCVNSPNPSCSRAMKFKYYPLPAETGLRAVRKVCRMSIQEMATALGTSYDAMQGMLKRNASLKDDPYSPNRPNFYLIREFGIDPGSCHKGEFPLNLAGYPFNITWRSIWKVSDAGDFSNPAAQLASKYLWTMDWYGFGGAYPIRFDDEGMKARCIFLHLDPDKLLLRRNDPLSVLDSEKRTYFYRLSARYIKELSLSGGKGSYPEEAKREYERSKERENFYRNQRMKLLRIPSELIFRELLWIRPEDILPFPELLKSSHDVVCPTAPLLNRIMEF